MLYTRTAIVQDRDQRRYVPNPPLWLNRSEVNFVLLSSTMLDNYIHCHFPCQPPQVIPYSKQKWWFAIPCHARRTPRWMQCDIQVAQVVQLLAPVFLAHPFSFVHCDQANLIPASSSSTQMNESCTFISSDSSDFMVGIPVTSSFPKMPLLHWLSRLGTDCLLDPDGSTAWDRGAFCGWVLSWRLFHYAICQPSCSLSPMMLNPQQWKVGFGITYGTSSIRAASRRFMTGSKPPL